MVMAASPCGFQRNDRTDRLEWCLDADAEVDRQPVAVERL
jgi:hypothetical protein